MMCVHSVNTCTAPAFAWAQDTRHAQEGGGGCDEVVLRTHPVLRAVAPIVASIGLHGVEV